MASNTITIQFEPCSPSPFNGYRVRYRPIGSTEEYRIWPINFTSSPAVFTDTSDPLDTGYEGFIEGDCGDGKFGVPVPWLAGEGQSGESPSESDSGVSESESGGEGIGDFYQYAVEVGTICGETSNLLYSATPYGAGVQMFLEPALINPLTGFNFIMPTSSGIVRSVSSLNGVVGGLTGDAC